MRCTSESTLDRTPCDIVDCCARKRDPRFGARVHLDSIGRCPQKRLRTLSSLARRRLRSSSATRSMPQPRRQNICKICTAALSNQPQDASSSVARRLCSPVEKWSRSSSRHSSLCRRHSVAVLACARLQRARYRQGRQTGAASEEKGACRGHIVNARRTIRHRHIISCQIIVSLCDYTAVLSLVEQSLVLITYFMHLALTFFNLSARIDAPVQHDEDVHAAAAHCAENSRTKTQALARRGMVLHYCCRD